MRAERDGGADAKVRASNLVPKVNRSVLARGGSPLTTHRSIDPCPAWARGRSRSHVASLTTTRESFGGRVHILVGTDGSPLSVSAAERAMAILGKPDRVTVLTVLTEMPGIDTGGFGASGESPSEQEQQWRAEIAKANAELARTAAVLTNGLVDERIEFGAEGVAATICDVATELGVDVIVLGSHGHGGLGRLFLGSVSEHVVRHASCPVLVVRGRNPAETSSDDT